MGEVKEILKLKPQGKGYLWGGNRLKREYQKEFTGEILAETWELSCHQDGPSTITNGVFAGKTLVEYIQTKGHGILGENCKHFREFPILIKFIDARQDLSVQVHPDDSYAWIHEHQYGKTEMWYIMDCDTDAYLYYGLKDEISKEEFAKKIKDNTLLDILNKVSIRPGDVFFIEAGTIHAIGKNTLIAEIQQNSNVTYRVYDFDRKGADGKRRELHINQALEVTTLAAVKKKAVTNHLAYCKYFTVDKITLNGKESRCLSGEVGKDTFVSILVLSGTGKLMDNNGAIHYSKGDSFFLPAELGVYQIAGNGEFLLTYVAAAAVSKKRID